MAVLPGNYSPDNWSSGYRIKTVDSADKRAELFNDFSYWMVRKFELEIDTRQANDLNIISLVNNATNSIAANRTSINWLSDRRTEMLNVDNGLLDSISWLKARNLEKDSSISEIYKITGALQNTSSSQGTSISWLGDRRLEMLSSINDLYTLNSANNTSVAWLKARNLEKDATITDIYKVTGALQTKNASQDTSISWLSDRNLEKDASITDIYKVTGALQTKNASQDTSIGWLSGKISEHDNSFSDLYSLTSVMNDNISDNKASILSVTTAVNSIKDYTALLTAMNANQLLTTSAVNSTSTNMNNLFAVAPGTHNLGWATGDGLFTIILKSQFTRLIDVLHTVSSKIKDYSTLLTTLNLSTVANKTAIDSFSDDNAENLTLINGTLKGLKNYDDTSFKNLLNNLVYSTNFENGILSTDGTMTRLFKGQFTRLIAELNRQLTLSFTTTTDNIDAFETYLREEFALLNDWASLQVDWSTMINENILVAIAALDKIALKTNGDVNVSVPAFDFDRLREILETLSFGNVVNEAGTNLWDVLKQLIDSLGNVVESIVNIVPDLIDKLIDLIIPENPNFFSEDVKALTDAFDMKFEWAFNLNSSFKSVFSQPKSLKSLTVPINGKNYKVVPDVVDLNMIKTIFTGYFCFLTLFTSYKRIVGGGDVIQ